MKTLTLIGLAGSSVVACAMAYTLYDKVSTEKLEAVQAEMVAAQVAHQMFVSAEMDCLAKNIYHEARNEGMTGQRAVAWATLNRVHSDKYPDTVCEVVYQAVLNEDGIPLRDECQFSWFCDGKSDEIENQAAWNVAEQIAVEVTNSYGKETDPTNGAFMYHAYYVEPYWATSYEKTARIDSHIFYN